MAKNSNIYKFDVIERVLAESPCTTKEEVLELARIMRDIALSNKNYNMEVKTAFVDAYNEINVGLTIENIKEIKAIINNNKK